MKTDSFWICIRIWTVLDSVTSLRTFEASIFWEKHLKLIRRPRDPTFLIQVCIQRVARVCILSICQRIKKSRLLRPRRTMTRRCWMRVLYRWVLRAHGPATAIWDSTTTTYSCKWWRVISGVLEEDWRSNFACNLNDICDCNLKSRMLPAMSWCRWERYSLSKSSECMWEESYTNSPVNSSTNRFWSNQWRLKSIVLSPGFWKQWS